MPPQQGDTKVRPRSKPRRSGRPIWMDAPSPLVRLAKGLTIAAILIVMLYPFAYVILASFGTSNSYKVFGLIPSGFSLSAYTTILTGGVVSRALLVSVGITIVGTLLSLAFTLTLAYGLTQTRDMPGGKVILYLILFTMFFGAGIIPNYLLVKTLEMIDSYWSLIIPMLISVFNLVVVRNFFMQLPNDVLEAARIDGASEWMIFSRIVLPLSKAVIAVIGLFYAVAYWNSFFAALIYLNDTSKWPIQLVLNQYVLQGSALGQIQNPNTPLPPAEAVQMAVVVVATIPILVLYPFVQKFFTKGVLTGAIKG